MSSKAATIMMQIVKAEIADTSLLLLEEKTTGSKKVAEKVKRIRIKTQEVVPW